MGGREGVGKSPRGKKEMAPENSWSECVSLGGTAAKRCPPKDVLVCREESWIGGRVPRPSASTLVAETVQLARRTCGSSTGNPTLIPRGEDRQGQGRPGLFSPSRRRKTLPRPSSLRRPPALS